MGIVESDVASILPVAIGHLCERGREGPWGEPLNTLSSLAFLYVAVALYRLYRKHSELKGLRVWDIRLLLANVVCIGIASTVFHTVPNQYTELADITFIVAFINIYFFSAMIRIVKCGWYQTIICFFAYAGVTHILVAQFPHAMNDSIGYLSSMMALIMIAVYLNMKRRLASRAFLVASLVGVVSLFMRVVDKEVCEVIPVGTHCLWHVLNATLIYILMRQLIRNVNRRERMLREANIYLA